MYENICSRQKKNEDLMRMSDIYQANRNRDNMVRDAKVAGIYTDKRNAKEREL